MCDFPWKIYLGICVFVLAKRDFPTFAEVTAPKDISLDFSSDTWQTNRNHSQFLDSKPLLDFKESQKFSRHLFRMKRSNLFPTGIKVCPEESIEQSTANHLKYFKLRVCQEAIWEAFKIFLDRLPGQEEYKKWLNECEAGTVNIFEMGTNFSQSEEYQSLIAKKLSYTKEAMDGFCSDLSSGFRMSTPSPVGDTTTLRDIVASIPPPDMVSTDSHLDRTEKIEDHEVSNEITRDYTKLMKPAHEQLVVFSILLPEEKYINELSDPSTEEYQQLSQQLISEIQNAYEGLPGYKNIHVTEFRSTQDNRVEVLYVVVFDRKAMSNVIWDWVNLQPNKVEQNSFSEIEDNSTVYTDSDFRHYIAEILHKNILFENASLPLDPSSLQLINVKEVATSMIEIPSWITAKPIDDDHAIVSEWPSADKSSASNILPFDLPGTDLIFDSDNNVWIKPDGFMDSESILNSKTDVTISPEDLLFMDEKQKIHPETPLFFETDSHIDLESHSNLSLLDIGLEKEKELEGLLVPSTVFPHIVPKEILPTIDSAIPLSVTSPAASVLAIEPSTDEGLPTTFLKEETQQSSINKEKDTTDYYGSGSGQQPQANLETWLKTEGSGMHDYNETYFTPDSPKDDIKDIQVVTISQSSIDTEITLDERVMTSIETYSTIKLEHSTQEHKIISEVTEIYDLILTEQSSKNQSHTTITIKALEKPEIILSAYSTVESPVIQSPELEKELVTKELEVTDRAYEVTTYYSHEMNQEEGIDSHVELPTHAHSTEMVGISGITPENPNNVTIPARALVVFFSLRVTNMIFSEDLFNKNSPEYKALEQRFLELLVPYLQSNLTGFQNLEILNFRNGSIVVNSRMKFARPVPRNVTNSVYMILEDFCNTAYQTMNLAIDKYSLDVESGVQADPCKFQACNEFSECLVNQWSGEAECVCYPGYLSINGLPCNSICLLQRNFCQNDGKCDIIPGQGAICRCRVGENWWYRGERCEEYVSEPLVVGIAIASVAVFLLIACTVTFFLARTLRDQNTKSEIEDSFVQGDSLSSIEYAVKYNPMYESDTTGYSHYYRRCPQLTSYSSTSNETSTEYSSEEIKHIYDNRELSKEEIQDRIRIIELYAKDHQFADFVKRHQM
ncbi:interphotoreceptor matrix proteoglycan 2 [Pseudonaja textilis]|uniref:interphotoreceptor matrix proteoglycan 2 n=1 Tax=Pseudonaja textilis TaxID=8673 RepID=UPI000EA93B6C|nr:interphotoreceptor matrix proteoglycan 2 [Pseudonaja textilis]